MKLPTTIPWSTVLCALLAQTSSIQTTQFLDRVRSYCGADRWADRLPVEEFDAEILRILHQIPVVRVGPSHRSNPPTSGEIPVGRGGWSLTSLPSVGDVGIYRLLLRGTAGYSTQYLETCRRSARMLQLLQEDGSPSLLGERLRCSADMDSARDIFAEVLLSSMPEDFHPYFRGMMSEGDLHIFMCRQYPDLPLLTILRKARVLSQLKFQVGLSRLSPQDGGEIRLLDPSAVDRWTKNNLGTNLTAFWIAYQDITSGFLDRVLRTIKLRFPVSAAAGTAEDEMREAIARKISNNAFSRHIIEGKINAAAARQWITKQVCSIVRDKGQDALLRSSVGARTEGERRQREEVGLEFGQFGDLNAQPKDELALERMADPEENAEDRLEFESLKARALRLVSDLFDEPELPWAQVFEAHRFAGLRAAELAERVGIPERDAQRMVVRINHAVIANRDLFQDIAEGYI